MSSWTSTLLNGELTGGCAAARGLLCSLMALLTFAIAQVIGHHRSMGFLSFEADGALDCGCAEMLCLKVLIVPDGR